MVILTHLCASIHLHRHLGIRYRLVLLVLDVLSFLNLLHSLVLHVVIIDLKFGNKYRRKT